MNDSKMTTGPVPLGWQNLEEAETKLKELFRGMVEHNGVSKLQIEVTPLKKGRKDVVISSGKDFHFVLKPFGGVYPVGTQGKPVQTPVADTK